jgi:hypothetical protein
MSGTVNISRAIFDHEFFASEPMTEREAWMWLIMEASWKPRKKRAGDVIVDLERGQLAASVRFMAAAWKWTPARVQRYLCKLKRAEMISQMDGKRVTVLAIKNYDSFQSALDAPKNRYRTDTEADTCKSLKYNGKMHSSDTPETENRYRSDTNEKKDARRGEGKEVSPVGDTPPPIDEIAACVSAYNATADRAGWPKVQTVSKARRSALSQRLRECGGATGWEVALAKAEASDFLNGRTAKPFTASFDFLTQAKSFTKLMEGNYDNRASRPSAPDNPTLRAIARAAGAFEASPVDWSAGRGLT